MKKRKRRQVWRPHLAAGFLLILAALVSWSSGSEAQGPTPNETQVFRDGLAAFEAGDPQAAYDIWAPAAVAGEPLAQYGLGKLYETGGPGFAPDLEQSVTWYERAAGQGVPAALNNLARFYAEGRGVERDTDQALLFWSQAARLGHPHAQYNLGLALFRGEWLEQDQAGAVQWFLQSAAAGLPEAQFAAGQIFERGIHRDIDLSRAAEWYRQAADQGHVAAEQSVERLAPALAAQQTPQAVPISPADPPVSEAVAPTASGPEATPRGSVSEATETQTANAQTASTETASTETADSQTADVPPPLPPRRPEASSPNASEPADGQSSAQVAERTPATATPVQTSEPSAQTGPWRVWLGSASSGAEAEGLASQLVAAGPALRADQIEATAAGSGFRLLAGRFSDRAGAQTLCESLRRQTPTVFCVPVEN